MLKKISLLALVLLLFSCSTTRLTESFNFVKTYSSANDKGKEGWSKVSLELDGPGTIRVFAYKKSANPLQQIAASHVNNQQTDALLFPGEDNYIALLYSHGSYEGTKIFNNVSGDTGKSYTIKVKYMGDEEFTAELIDDLTQKRADYIVTRTP